MKKLYPICFCILLIYSCSNDSGEGGEQQTKELQACFEISKDTLSVGETLQITDCSKGASNHSYAFGNGETSADTSPEAVYQEGGDYTIDLTVTNDEMATKTFSRQVHVTAVASKYIYPDIPDGFSALPLEAGINPNNGNLYSIELLEDNVGSGGAKYYYKEVDLSFNFTSNYIADQPFESNSAFVNFYPSGNMNFVFARTLASLYGTQEITFNSGWGFLTGINSATKHSYGYLPDGINFLYYGTQEDNGLYKAAIERRNASGDAFEIFLEDLDGNEAMIGDMKASGDGYIAFGAVFTKNTTSPYIADYTPALIFYDGNLSVTSHTLFSTSVLDDKISSSNDLNGSYHLEQLSNGNIVMYGNGELIVADATGNMLSTSYFENSNNNQALIGLGDTFVLSSDNYLRKFDSGGSQIKALKYNGNYLPEILEISNTLFFAAGYDTEGEIKMFLGAADKNLNLIDLN
ncbi:PKD domain-containing protein [Muriicola sp. Z0-33]|uniref:PKD domain-containing protein n=1 Tax=Muriicola sp. Z0-33 TaxID=2816957 RepID=UPI002237E136|nr:PKD domain-containing protein [Muriicola sp. Z0-33]MCW5517909.1 PKD domain-containing protein [Muriicola sp. Z0-33]